MKYLIVILVLLVSACGSDENSGPCSWYWNFEQDIFNDYCRGRTDCCACECVDSGMLPPLNHVAGSCDCRPYVCDMHEQEAAEACESNSNCGINRRTYITNQCSYD